MSVSPTILVLDLHRDNFEVLPTVLRLANDSAYICEQAAYQTTKAIEICTDLRVVDMLMCDKVAFKWFLQRYYWIFGTVPANHCYFL